MYKTAGGAFILCISLMLSHTGYATTCTVGYRSCHKHQHDLPPPSNACAQLQVIIHNGTKYAFKEKSSSLTYGTVSNQQSSNHFPDIKVSSKAQTISIEGGLGADNNYQDEVKGTVTYVAYLADTSGNATDKLTGAQFSIQFSKNSCNVSLARCRRQDQYCFCIPSHTAGDCTETGLKHPCQFEYYNPADYINHLSYEPTHWNDNYWNKSVVNCSIPSPLSASMSADSSYAVYLSSIKSTPPGFSCTDYAVCNYNGNTSGVVEFTINASPIETLKITFFGSTVNSQSPLTKTILSTLYNSLNTTYLGQLSTYYSVHPVVVQDKNIQFSTLCSSADCLQPST